MKVSLKWLKEYVQITAPVKELAHRLTMAGTEVSGITTVGGSWDKVSVGYVLAVDPHPNADRLRLATVDLGGEHMTVVCGAPNVAPGQKVPFAREGAHLFDGHTGKLTELKPAKIRGVLSAGMVCSEKELGLSDDHTRIMVLPEDAPLGVLLSDYLGDSILDLEVTPNRPDCLSVMGVAWEAAALTGGQVCLPGVQYEESGEEIEGIASVDIADPDLCPRYCASLVTGVRVGPSPRWMQDRLIALGMRPINNLVDITNYVMLEYGQPLHAFDYERLRDRKIIVRRAVNGERLTTLDGVERSLDPHMLVIADGKGPVALAGVMGGADSEVTEDTTSVLLESANFHNSSIRYTSALLRMRSEASLRFEKGLSPELPPIALKRATRLLVELGGGKAARGIIDVYPGRVERKPVILTGQRLKKVLGMEIGVEEMTRVLTSLGFECQRHGASDLLVAVPYWRTDISLEDDLVEEIARIVGYDRVPTTMPGGLIPRYEPDPLGTLKEKVRDALVGCGMQEVINYTLTSCKALEKVGSYSASGTEPLRVANPMSPVQEFLRTTLRAGLLSNLASNEKRVEGGIRLFEVGKTFSPRGKELPEEQEVLGGVVAGAGEEPHWLHGERSLSFFDAKGIMETLFACLSVSADFQVAEDYVLTPGRTARAIIQDPLRGLLGDVPVGIIGEVRPEVLESFDISSHPVFLFEVDLAALLPLMPSARKYRPLPRFPAVVRDVALVLDEGLAARSVEKIIRESPLAEDVALFDIYLGEQIPRGKKSLAYHITYQSPTRTLTDEEVNSAQGRLVERLARELGASLRG
ncbi:MAG: phenylalanine--tRNA ligase subunit beta [Chloroflexi bacterium]|nr:phenylalanine--tRNA ligase subunit beta [Chloroflexota bacterium]